MQNKFFISKTLWGPDTGPHNVHSPHSEGVLSHAGPRKPPYANTRIPV